MENPFKFSLHILLILLTATFPTLAADPPSPAKIIFDTDMDSDCDDAGALAILHALADNGEAEILATIVSSKNPHSPACVDAINTYYNRPNLPIGAPKGKGTQKPSKYAQHIAQKFPHNIGRPNTLPDARHLYRDILSRQPDHSVTIVTVGYLTNIADLLMLPAEKDHPSGLDLVKQKVKLWACMGGNFIGKPATDDLKLTNNNFTYDKESALYAIQNWPVDLVFVGREIGSVPSGLKAGARLKETPESNPVRLGYQLYFDGEVKSRHVADPTTVLFAVRGLRDYWDIESNGSIDLNPDMTFRWTYARDSRQSYLLKRHVNGQPNDRTIEKMLEDLMIQSPKRN